MLLHVARFELRVPGVHLMLSHGAPAGGEGDGGSLTHGLFGVVGATGQAGQTGRQYEGQGENRKKHAHARILLKTIE